MASNETNEKTNIDTNNDEIIAKNSEINIPNLRNEFLSYIKELENKIGKKINNEKEIRTQELNEINSQLKNLNEINERFTNSFAEISVKLDKLKELETFKNKTESQMITHEIRINNTMKDLSDSKIKYDKIFVDNLLVPGFIGQKSQYKTMGDYIYSNIINVSGLNTSKDQMKRELTEIRTRYDNFSKEVVTVVNAAAQRCNDYSDFKNSVLDKEIRLEIKNNTEKIFDIRLQNVKEAISLEKKTKELQDEWNKISDMKDEIYKKLNDHLLIYKTDANEALKRYDEMKGEFNKIKSRFGSLVEFIKDVRFRKNLGTFQEIKKRDINNLTNKLKFTKKRSESLKLDKVDLNYDFVLGKDVNSDVDDDEEEKKDKVDRLFRKITKNKIIFDNQNNQIIIGNDTNQPIIIDNKNKENVIIDNNKNNLIIGGGNKEKNINNSNNNNNNDNYKNKNNSEKNKNDNNSKEKNNINNSQRVYNFKEITKNFQDEKFNRNNIRYKSINQGRRSVFQLKNNPNIFKEIILEEKVEKENKIDITASPLQNRIKKKKENSSIQTKNKNENNNKKRISIVSRTQNEKPALSQDKNLNVNDKVLNPKKINRNLKNIDYNNSEQDPSIQAEKSYLEKYLTDSTAKNNYNNTNYNNNNYNNNNYNNTNYNNNNYNNTNYNNNNYNNNNYNNNNYNNNNYNNNNYNNNYMNSKNMNNTVYNSRFPSLNVDTNNRSKYSVNNIYKQNNKTNSFITKKKIIINNTPKDYDPNFNFNFIQIGIDNSNSQKLVLNNNDLNHDINNNYKAISYANNKNTNFARTFSPSDYHKEYVDNFGNTVYKRNIKFNNNNFSSAKRQNKNIKLNK